VTRVRLLLADDQELVRTGLRMVIEAQESLEVVGEAADGNEAIERVRELRPDVVLMDIRMPARDGIEATRLIAQEFPETKVLILTTFDADEYVYDALRAGAGGFLLKDAPPARLVDGIRAVAEGEALLAPTVTRRLIEDVTRRRAAPPPPPALDELTPREREVLVLVARGLPNSEIASTLVVEESTVKTHIGRVFMKLGLRDRAQAVVLAYEAGLVVPGEAGEED